MSVPQYAELQAISNFTFLTGASHPEELVARAKELGLVALGIADVNTLAGVVRAHVAARHHGMRVLVGAKLTIKDSPLTLICYPKNLQGYRWLSATLTQGKMRAKKGATELFWADVTSMPSDIVTIVPVPHKPGPQFFAHLLALRTAYVAVSFTYDGLGDQQIALASELENQHGFNVVVTNDCIAHSVDRRPLADVLYCIKNHTTIAASTLLLKNNERHLKSPEEMWRLFRMKPRWLTNSVNISQSIEFSLEQIRYRYPTPKDTANLPVHEYLQRETWRGAHRRYGENVPISIQKTLASELALVAKLGIEQYFLTVYDIVNFAKNNNILCQGRGSAANSAICFCLGITEVDPSKIALLMGRFISEERNEPPDIDVDFESGRRELVMQYIYRTYGRRHAAITATVITYKKRSAVREVAKVFGLSADAIDSLQKALRGVSLSDIAHDHFDSWRHESSKSFLAMCREAGMSEHAEILQQIINMAQWLKHFPRHLGQHVGGFVINETPLHELVPIQNAAMPDRTFIEWDKDDLDALGIFKIDILSLGILSAIKRSFDLIKTHYRKELSLSSIPQEDKNVYNMLSKADAIGVFQVESRAQMSMLPRLKPKTFYDLVIEVAIIRPGPIQGNMLHPYLRRRNGQEKVAYPSQALKGVLEKTLGVPLFQEQVMQIAVVGASFTEGEADQLRRSMATFKRLGTVNHFQTRFLAGMKKNGYTEDFAAQVFKQILGFAEYGFPESHAASFANLVYVSAWLKYYYPAAFTVGLLNSQPMGFYGPQQLIDDARRHQVTVLPIDSNHSHYEHTLEPDHSRQAIRLGFCQVKGLSKENTQWLVACRPHQGYKSIVEIHRMTSTSTDVLSRLNKANAFSSLVSNEREGDWHILGLKEKSLPLLDMLSEEHHTYFKNLNDYERMRLDIAYTGVSLKRHPIDFLRPKLTRHNYIKACDIANLASGTIINVAGLVIIRQRPATARGVIFFTLEDETGFFNIVIWPSFLTTHKKEVLLSPFVAIKGTLEIKDGVHHIITQQIRDISRAFAGLAMTSRDFR